MKKFQQTVQTVNRDELARKVERKRFVLGRNNKKGQTLLRQRLTLLIVYTVFNGPGPEEIVNFRFALG